MARRSALLALGLALAAACAAAAAPDGRLEVAVLADGRPQAGAVVLLQCEGDGDLGVVARAPTGADGTARLALPPAPGDGCLVWAGRVPAAGLAWARPTAGPVRLSLPAGARLRLRVTDARTGKPIPASRIEVRARIRPTGEGAGPHGSSGLRTLDVPSALLEASAEGPGGPLIVSGLPRMDHARAELGVRAPGYAASRLREIPLGAARRDLGTVSLWPVASVCGTVTGAAGGERVVVHLTGRAGSGERRTTADGSGGFCFEDVPSGPRFSLWASWLFGESEPLEVVAPASGLVLAMPEPRRIAGTVRDAETGDPIQEFDVEIGPAELRTEHGDGLAEVAAAFRRRHHVSDPEGRFSLPVPLELEAVARFTAPDHAPVEVTVPEGASVTDLEVELSPGAEVAGWVVAARSGEPVAGAEVVATCERAARAGATVADGEGRFELQHLPAGECRIEADAEGFAPATVTLALDAGTRRDGLEIELPPAAAIVGRVVDRTTGAPVGGARLTVLAAGAARPEPAGTAISAGDGTFRIDDLAAGPYALMAEAPGYVPATVAAEATVPAGPGVEVTLERGVTVEGVVRGALGDGAGLAVVLRSGAAIVRGRTAYGGTFRIEGVPPGTVAFSVLALEFATQRGGGTERGGTCMGTIVVPPAEDAVHLALDCTAGTHTVRGTLRRPGGEPAPGVFLRLADPAPGGDVLVATTDAWGRFAFIRVRPGTYRLTARLPGAPPPGHLLWSGDVTGDRTLDLVFPEAFSDPTPEGTVTDEPR